MQKCTVACHPFDEPYCSPYLSFLGSQAFGGKTNRQVACWKGSTAKAELATIVRLPLVSLCAYHFVCTPSNDCVFATTTVCPVLGVRCKQWETAVSLLKEMTRGSAAGLAPGLVSYGAAITACATCKQGDAAVDLLREMPIVGITPDSMTYTSAISACGRSGQWERAVGLFREISMLRVGFRPDAVSYSAVITACGDGGQWEEASRWERQFVVARVAAAVCRMY